MIEPINAACNKPTSHTLPSLVKEVPSSVDLKPAGSGDTSLFCSPSSTTPSAMTSSHERLPYWDMDSLLNAPLAKVVIPTIWPLRA